MWVGNLVHDGPYAAQMSSRATSLHRGLKMIVGITMMMLFVILFLVATMVKNGGAGPPVAAVLGVGVFGVAMSALIQAIGFRLPPTPPATETEQARDDSARAFTSSTILRLSIAEAVGIVALALAFVVESGGGLLLLLGIALSEALLYLQVWPGDRVIARAEEALEREGGRSHLREALELPAPQGR